MLMHKIVCILFTIPSPTHCLDFFFAAHQVVFPSLHQTCAPGQLTISFKHKNFLICLSPELIDAIPRRKYGLSLCYVLLVSCEKVPVSFDFVHQEIHVSCVC